jgi:hypothetical protein
MVSDHDRRELYDALERRLGEGPAETMMELLPPVGWADVARQSDLVALRGELKSVLPKLIAANMGMAFATAGLVLAAAKLA